MLAKKIKNKTIKIGVIGLGYVGLPLANSLAQSGAPVTGFDLSQEKVDTINKGKSYISDVPTEEIAKVVNELNSLTATTDLSKLAEMDAVFICVPTPFDKQKAPDLSFIEAASEAVAKTLKKGQIIVLQSTTFPGTTDDVVKPILEKTGLKAGADFNLAFSPERIDPGNKQFTSHNTPKVVGGTTKEATEIVCDIFKLFIDADKVHAVSCPKTAEMCKILENTFRAVNIALVNELLVLSERMGIDIWEVIDAAATKPFGFMPFYPGPGVGGHCIPVDPFYLSWKAREYDFFTKFIEIAADVNMNMPYYTIQRIQKALSERKERSFKDSKVLVMGAAFKKDIDDNRNSVAMYLMKLLLAEGVKLSYNDPFVPEIFFHHDLYMKENEHKLKSEDISEKKLKEYDCVVIAVAHSAYDMDMIVKNSSLVFDAVNATKGIESKNIIKL